MGPKTNPNAELAGLFGSSNKEDNEDPFRYAIFHGYTMNPIPAKFFLKGWVFFAIFSNAGQSWMSAYLSKVLSSLWKNICAAVAMALVAIIEKCLMPTPQDWAETKPVNVVLGTAGIILTVFVFQLAPKAPKP